MHIDDERLGDITPSVSMTACGDPLTYWERGRKYCVRYSIPFALGFPFWWGTEQEPAEKSSKEELKHCGARDGKSIRDFADRANVSCPFMRLFHP